MEEAALETVCVRGAGYMRLVACAFVDTSTMARKSGAASTVSLANRERPRARLAARQHVTDVALASSRTIVDARLARRTQPPKDLPGLQKPIACATRDILGPMGRHVTPAPRGLIRR